MTNDLLSPASSVRPSPGGPAPTGAERRTATLRRLGRDLVYLLLGFPLATASFVVMITGLSVSAGLLIVWVGVPLLVVTIYAARLFAAVERARLTARGDVLAPTTYRQPAPGRSWAGALLDRIRDPQSWLDIAHGIVAFPISVVTWCIALVWTTGLVSGLTYPAWSPLLPEDTEDNDTLAELLDWGISNNVIYLVLGVFFAVTLVPVIRAAAGIQAALAKAMLSNEHVAELQAGVATLTTARDAAVASDADQRRRLERDIHDGPQQRLVRLGMDLASAQRRLDDDPEAARQLLAEARAHSAAALEELRALSRGIVPPILADRGLEAALTELAARSTVPARLDIELPTGERLPAPVEIALYFTVSEALTNVAKHAQASNVTIRVRRIGEPVDRAIVEVVDDGVGGADLAKGHGLAGLAGRLAVLSGTLHITSPPGGPTTITAEVPCGF